MYHCAHINVNRDKTASGLVRWQTSPHRFAQGNQFVEVLVNLTVALTKSPK